MSLREGKKYLKFNYTNNNYSNILTITRISYYYINLINRDHRSRIQFY